MNERKQEKEEVMISCLDFEHRTLRSPITGCVDANHLRLSDGIAVILWVYESL